MGPISSIPPIDAQQPRAASKRFPKTTSARDGLHPRHFALLSGEALGNLADLLNTFENVGVLPSQMQGVLRSLIDKPGGGDRPMGLLQGTARLWYKCRTQALKSWEASKAFAAASGRSAVDAVWRRAFRAEAGIGADDHSLSIFSDLRKCYEHVRHRGLVAESALGTETALCATA